MCTSVQTFVLNCILFLHEDVDLDDDIDDDDKIAGKRVSDHAFSEGGAAQSPMPPTPATQPMPDRPVDSIEPPTTTVYVNMFHILRNSMRASVRICIYFMCIDQYILYV